MSFIPIRDIDNVKDLTLVMSYGGKTTFSVFAFHTYHFLLGEMK